MYGLATSMLVLMKMRTFTPTATHSSQAATLYTSTKTAMCNNSPTKFHYLSIFHYLCISFKTIAI